MCTLESTEPVAPLLLLVLPTIEIPPPAPLAPPVALPPPLLPLLPLLVLGEAPLDVLDENDVPEVEPDLPWFPLEPHATIALMARIVIPTTKTNFRCMTRV
jgi:hypothetical protein